MSGTKKHTAAARNLASPVPVGTTYHDPDRSEPGGLPSQQQGVSDRNFSLNDPTGDRHDNVMAAEIINPRPLVAPEGNNAAVNPSWNSTILFPGTLISEGKEARFRRKVQRILPPGFTIDDDAFDVLYQATRAAFSSLVGPVDSATFQMIVGPRAAAAAPNMTVLSARILARHAMKIAPRCTVNVLNVRSLSTTQTLAAAKSTSAETAMIDLKEAGFVLPTGPVNACVNGLKNIQADEKGAVEAPSTTQSVSRLPESSPMRPCPSLANQN
ncbi:hypothetical protein BV898_18208 [Hypsibius exemplaris]|uniref:Uncharacterized protein n=1 Tax=Hypsibius exemplaris TaxID=2072580 RepID=A0A9X6NGT6_HYPEX|nr:hypothetical protein BV898_18208 [Hypsibius exemplaris]